jgi:hypothetical protein
MPHVRYDADHRAAPAARPALDRPDPGRRGWRSPHALTDRRHPGWRALSLRRRDRVALAKPERIGFAVTESDPHGSANDRRAKPYADRDADGGAHNGSTDDGTVDGRADHGGADAAADQPARTDRNALGPA